MLTLTPLVDAGCPFTEAPLSPLPHLLLNLRRCNISSFLWQLFFQWSLHIRQPTIKHGLLRWTF